MTAFIIPKHPSTDRNKIAALCLAVESLRRLGDSIWRHLVEVGKRFICAKTLSKMCCLSEASSHFVVFVCVNPDRKPSRKMKRLNRNHWIDKSNQCWALFPFGQQHVDRLRDRIEVDELRFWARTHDRASLLSTFDLRLYSLRSWSCSRSAKSKQALLLHSLNRNFLLSPFSFLLYILYLCTLFLEFSFYQHILWKINSFFSLPFLNV